MNDSSAARSALLAGFLLLTGMLSATVQAAERSGSVDWGRRVALGTLESGVVAEVPVAQGQRVSKGELLLRLDQRGFKADLAAAQAAHRHAQALLAEAQREFDRAEELYDRTVLSEHERTVAIIGLREAQAVAEKARAGLVRAQLALEHSELHAPLDGLVETLSVVPGQVVNARLEVPNLVTLADDRWLEVRVQGDPAMLQGLLAAKNIQVELDGKMLPVVQVFPSAPAANADGLVGIRLKRPQGLVVRPGQAAAVLW